MKINKQAAFSSDKKIKENRNNNDKNMRVSVGFAVQNVLDEAD